MTTNTKLNELDFLKMADTLNQSEQYRVITKYNKPEFYNLNADVLRWTLCVGQDSSKIKI